MTESESQQELLPRLEDFAVRVIKLYAALPKSTVAQVLGKQLLRAGTSAGAHFAEASHSRSSADFVSKTEAAAQELQETLYWLRLIARSGTVAEKRMNGLVEERMECRAILMSMARNARRKLVAKPA